MKPSVDSWRVFSSPTSRSGFRLLRSTVWVAASQPEAGFPSRVPQTGIVPHTLNCRPDSKNQTHTLRLRTSPQRRACDPAPAKLGSGCPLLGHQRPTFGQESWSRHPRQRSRTVAVPTDASKAQHVFIRPCTSKRSDYFP